MNTSYLLKIKYLLGLSNSKEIFDWGFQEIEQGNNDNEMLELVTLKSDNYGGIIEKLTKISSSKVPPAKLKGINFVKFFEWLSASLGEITHSSDGQQINLPKPDEWMDGFKID